MKKIFTILMIFVLVATSVYSVFGQSIRPGFSPPDGCYTPKLVTTYQGTLYNIPESVKILPFMIFRNTMRNATTALPCKLKLTTVQKYSLT